MVDKKPTIADKLPADGVTATPVAVTPGATPEKPLSFPTHIYQEAGALVCPNGDKVRSDADGLFCIINGKRVIYPVQ